MIFALVSIAVKVLGQESSLPKRYVDNDAYRIYDQLVPDEELWGNKTRIIQRETAKGQFLGMNIDSCVSPSVSHDFQAAIASFKTVNRKRWLLQRQFELDRPYELVASDVIKAVFTGTEQNNDGWQAFEEHFPGAGGYIVLSAVGFDRDKTHAVVFSGASCGSLCGSWSFHLFKKVRGEWKQVPGITCHTES